MVPAPEGTLMKHFRCGDVVPGCTRLFTGTEEDILAQVARHASDDHGLIELPTGMVAQIQSTMTPVRV